MLNEPNNTLRLQAAIRSRRVMQHEVSCLQSLLPTLANPDALPDELIIPMHNIIAIVPQEQYRFLADIKALFARLPKPLLEERHPRFVYDRVLALTRRQTATKIQETDLSEYWAAYRHILYAYGYVDNAKALRIQQRLRLTMLDVAQETIAKRQQGIITAGIIIGNHDDGQLPMG